MYMAESAEAKGKRGSRCFPEFSGPHIVSPCELRFVTAAAEIEGGDNMYPFDEISKAADKLCGGMVPKGSNVSRHKLECRF